MSQIANSSSIRDLPKLELHIHLEGTIAPELVQRMAAARGISLPRPLDQLYDLDDISKFLATLDWVCSLVSSPLEASMIADNFGQYCAAQNIMYAEVIVNPTHWQGLTYQELFPALSDAFDNVKVKYGVDIRLLPSILRQQSREEALEMVQWMGTANIPRIIGLSIDGNEAAAGPTGDRFAPAYALAHEFGFGLTTHAGESSGPQGVRDALDYLKADRIDHGVRAIEDPELVQRLITEKITLNVCLTSNCAILYESIDQHPFKALREAGVRMTLNTDDPVVLNTELCKELAWASAQMELSIHDIAELQRNAVNAAFCDVNTKTLLLHLIDTHMQGIV